MVRPRQPRERSSPAACSRVLRRRPGRRTPAERLVPLSEAIGAGGAWDAQAKHLLAGGMGPAQVAVSCGLADQSHLTRHFKRLVGVTPGAYAFGFSHRPLWSNN